MNKFICNSISQIDINVIYIFVAKNLLDRGYLIISAHFSTKYLVTESSAGLSKISTFLKVSKNEYCILSISLCPKVHY